jgi:hypothetical protein
MASWHRECYAGKTQEQIAAGYVRAFAKARRHLKKARTLSWQSGRMRLTRNQV